MPVDRRTVILQLIAAAAAAPPLEGLSEAATASFITGLPEPRNMIGNPSLVDLCRHPLLMKCLYRFSPGGQIAPSGAQGRNRGQAVWQIEEQRVGGEYVLRGMLNQRQDWGDIGWAVLDWGNAQQEASGRYRSRGGHYHSTSLFLDGLEQGMMADPGQATLARLEHLHQGARWMAANFDEGRKLNKGYTHRSFVCMSVLGRAAAVTGDNSLNQRACDWAELGLAAQYANGVNPELGGFDVSYQAVGAEAALLYLPVCVDSALKHRIRGMCSRALGWWCDRQAKDGSVTTSGSTRVGRERSFDGSIKTINYKDVLQALVWGHQLLKERHFLSSAVSFATHLRL